MTTQPIISLPWIQKRQSLPILPVFLPFFGCPTRCIFCAQHIQTGQGKQPLSATLAQARRQLALRRERNLGPAELAFFGGTFTAVPEAVQTACLSLAQEAFHNGDIHALRCSTRPDCISLPILQRLRAAGCTTIELGVQSLHTPALSQAQRGYTGDTALQACRQIRSAGMTCGVQLMPGMPGVTPAIFLEDVRRALDAGAALLRFYPCLVLRGTALETLYHTGAYAPWSLDVTLDTLAQGWMLAKAANIPVIRMGLAPEQGLNAAIVAGPVHPALGAEVQALALLHTVRQTLHTAGLLHAAALGVPANVRGCFWGDQRHLSNAWATMGITGKNLYWMSDNMIKIYAAV